jgi:hypothetical protein
MLLLDHILKENNTVIKKCFIRFPSAVYKCLCRAAFLTFINFIYKMEKRLVEINRGTIIRNRG